MPTVESDVTCQGVVEMSNLMPPERTHGLHLAYLVNYTHRTSELYRQSDEEMLNRYRHDLESLFPKAAKTIVDQFVFRAPFVEPLWPLGYLKKRPDVKGKIGAVGFCYGGGIVNMLATRLPDLGAGVPFYGGQPKPEEVANIKCPLLIQYAEKDDRINAGIPAFEEALKANKVKYQIFTYPGTQHGFNNDTTPRYDKAAATLAWQRTVDFFKKNLR